MLMLFTRCGSEDVTGCPDKTCSDYVTQREAQAAFDNDPDCLGELDNDNDGIACEHLSGGGTHGCSTTSNCGCSGKKKSECSGPCCRWIVGTGCRCN
jgi:hypothetical protein